MSARSIPRRKPCRTAFIRPAPDGAPSHYDVFISQGARSFERIGADLGYREAINLAEQMARAVIIEFGEPRQ